MRFDDFQSRVVAAVDDANELVSMLGIGAHAGALLDAHRRYLRESLDREASTGRVSQELGQVLRHLALIAEAHELSLNDVARRNVAKIRRKWREHPGVQALPSVPPRRGAHPSVSELAALTDIYAQKEWLRPPKA